MLAAMAVAASPARGGYVVGVEFVDQVVNNPVLTGVGTTVYPFDVTGPAAGLFATNGFVDDGALDGYTQQEVHDAIMTAVQQVFRSAEIGLPGQMLNVNIVVGAVGPEVGTVHQMGMGFGSVYGGAYPGGANSRPFDRDDGVYTNAMSVTLLNQLATIPQRNPGVTFDTLDQVLSAVAGTTSQEIAHTLGVWNDVPGDPSLYPGGVLPIMASGSTGLPDYERLNMRRFLDVPGTQPGGLSVTDVLVSQAGTTAVTDFNFDLQTDSADLAIWAAGRYSYGYGVKGGDADNDGDTDVDDLQMCKDNIIAGSGGAEIVRWIHMTYPLALVFGDYPMQYGTLSPLILAFFPLVALSWRRAKPLGSTLFQVSVSAVFGAIVFTCLSPNVFAPRYILAPLLLLILPAAVGAQLALGSKSCGRVLSVAVVGAVIVVLFGRLSQDVSRIGRDAGKYAWGRFVDSERLLPDCGSAEVLNAHAKLDEPVVLMSYGCYWVRSDLIGSCLTADQLAPMRKLATSRERWRWLYQQGVRLILLDARTFGAETPESIIAGPLSTAEVPDGLTVNVLYRKKGRIVLQLEKTDQQPTASKERPNFK